LQFLLRNIALVLETVLGQPTQFALFVMAQAIQNRHLLCQPFMPFQKVKNAAQLPFPKCTSNIVQCTSVHLVLIATASNAIDLWEFDKPSLLHIITAAVTLFNYSLYCDIQAYF